jgi:hypothetical protein
MCNLFVPPISNHSSLKDFNYKMTNLLLKFLKMNSGGNIIQVTGFKKQAYIAECKLGVNFNVVPIPLQTCDRLIIECRCINGLSFGNSDVLDRMVTAVFKNVFDVSEIKLEYHYSMYCSRD